MAQHNFTRSIQQTIFGAEAYRFDYLRCLEIGGGVNV